MKYDLRNPATVELIINKMLSKHNVDMKYVIAHPIVDGMDWFQYYTWSYLESQEFRSWLITFARTECSGRMSKAFAEKYYREFDDMWGLKIE